MNAIAVREQPRTSVARYGIPALIGMAAIVVLVTVARWAWGQPVVAAFVTRYPGISTGAEFVGTPGWVAALHALNLFFVVQLVRSGLAIRATRRPIGHWSPRGAASAPNERWPVTIEQWFHVSLDLLWLAAGAAFVVVMVMSGRWVRIVPTSWDVVPNALSVAEQYLSLHWPDHDGWVAYNALQLLSYFAVVFVLSPLAAITGWRMSPLWPRPGHRSGWFTVERARAVHFPVMAGFVGFVIIHVGLVACTGAVRSVNHMFAARDDDSLIGVLVLCGVLALAGAAIAAARPVVLRTLAGLTGRVTR